MCWEYFWVRRRCHVVLYYHCEYIKYTFSYYWDKIFIKFNHFRIYFYYLSFPANIKFGTFRFSSFKKEKKSLYCLVFPTISLLTYIIIGVFLENSSSLTKFIEHNTITSGEMYIKINTSLIEPSQIIFVVLLYFLVEYIILKILERMVKKNGNN